MGLNMHDIPNGQVEEASHLQCRHAYELCYVCMLSALLEQPRQISFRRELCDTGAPGANRTSTGRHLSFPSTKFSTVIPAQTVFREEPSLTAHR